MAQTAEVLDHSLQCDVSWLSGVTRSCSSTEKCMLHYSSCLAAVTGMSAGDAKHLLLDLAVLSCCLVADTFCQLTQRSEISQEQ